MTITNANATPLDGLLRDLRTLQPETPFYLYDADGARAALEDLLRLLRATLAGCQSQVYLPVFANPCLPLLDFLLAGQPRAGLLVNTIPELSAVRAYRWHTTPQVIFAGGVLAPGQVERVCRAADIFYATSLANFEQALASADRRALLGLRIDLSDRGEQRGIAISDLATYCKGASSQAAQVQGIHAYQGPNSAGFGSCLTHAFMLLDWCRFFPNLKQVNLSGGWPFAYTETAAALPSSCSLLGEYLSALVPALESSGTDVSRVQLAFEPGKFLLAAYGYFFCRVLESGPAGDVHVDASFTHLPALKIKGRNHAVTLLDKAWIAHPDGAEKKVLCHLRGCSGLSTDFLMPERVALPLHERDALIVIHDLGVYGWAGSYNFLGLQRPAELMRAGGSVRVVRSRQAENHLLYGLVDPAAAPPPEPIAAVAECVGRVPP